LTSRSSAVAIDIRENGAGRKLVRTRDAGGGSDLFKAPIAQIAIQNIRSFNPAKVEIAPAVAVDITRRDPGTVFENSIVFGERVGEQIGERDSGCVSVVA
jgi:hypothetical protein